MNLKCNNCPKKAKWARIIKTTDAEFDGEEYSNEATNSEEYYHYCDDHARKEGIID